MSRKAQTVINSFRSTASDFAPSEITFHLTVCDSVYQE